MSDWFPRSFGYTEESRSVTVGLWKHKSCYISLIISVMEISLTGNYFFQNEKNVFLHFSLCPIWNIVSQTDHYVPFGRLVPTWLKKLVLSIFDAMYFLKAVIYQAFFDINKCALSLFLSCSLSLQWKTGHFSPNTLISLAFLIFDLPEKCQNQSHNKDWKFHYLQLEVHIIILICINIGSTKFYKAYFAHICTL